MDHWIVFIIYPPDRKVVIFDSLHSKYISNLLLTIVVCIQLIGNTRKTLNAMIGDPTIRSRSMT